MHAYARICSYAPIYEQNMWYPNFSVGPRGWGPRPLWFITWQCIKPNNRG